MADRLLYRLSRVIHAPVEKVWEAWTEADQLAAWYGPVGFTAPRESVNVDPRVGGCWSATVVVPMDGSRHHFFGSFTEVVPRESLIFTMFYATDDMLEEVKKATGPSHRVELQFQDVEGDTNLTYSQFGELPQEQIPRAEAGTGSYLDSLAAFVE